MIKTLLGISATVATAICMVVATDAHADSKLRFNGHIETLSPLFEKKKTLGLAKNTICNFSLTEPCLIESVIGDVQVIKVQNNSFAIVIHGNRGAKVPYKLPVKQSELIEGVSLTQKEWTKAGGYSRYENKVFVLHLTAEEI